MWKEYQVKVNELPVTLTYNEDTVNNLFVPFLRRLSDKQKELGRRIVVFMAAPPATGKSSLTIFLESLSKDIAPVTAVGMDGFHYPEAYLTTHNIKGSNKPLKTIKGAPDTFDAESLAKKLAELTEEPSVEFPIYSRKLHDIDTATQTVTGDIILLEGNWLLLAEDRWRTLRKYADYTLFIRADENVLRERLINRKVMGGMERQAAEEFCEKSDLPNLRRVLKDSEPADETWQIRDDGDFVKAV